MRVGCKRAMDRASRYTLLADEIMMRVGCKRAIVYLDFVKDVSPVAIALREKGVKSCSYHGKSMSGHEKLKALENWKAGDMQVMVSILAFGLGIDDRDVSTMSDVHQPWRRWSKCLPELVGMAKNHKVITHVIYINHE